MYQNHITEFTELLDSNGNVKNPGYCEYNRYIYERSKVKGNKTRIKEWDFYQITDPIHTMQFNIFDISLGGAFTFALFNRETGEKVEKFAVSLLTFGSVKMEENTNVPHIVTYRNADTYAKIVAVRGSRSLIAEFSEKGDRFETRIDLIVPEDLQSLTMAVPFKEKGHFYLNQKMNSMVAKGYVKKNGETIKEFSEKDSFCVLDWGRGVWPYKGDWYWGNGNTYMPDGSVFGFEIGWGFGDMSKATENMLFYNGVGHKIEEVYLRKDPDDYMKPWVFSSNDGRFEMTMTPTHDNYTTSRVAGVIGNVCHQVFGLWNGTATLDDGTVLQIKDMHAFCEYSDNRW